MNPSDIVITLRVQDVNDNAPVFLQQPYNAEVDEVTIRLRIFHFLS